jgi:serine/threonine protein kinase
MTLEQWQKVEELFQAALDRPAPERSAFLNEACSGDADLRHETNSLIEAYDQAEDFIEEPALSEDAHWFLSDPEPADGREIGPYRIFKLLGAGGMGEVYLARDLRLDRMVALKTLPSYFVTDEIHLRRFQNEARTASALNHANILTIYEVGQFADIHFIAAEYIDGPTVRELIRAGDLRLGAALDVMMQLLSGLAAAHATGIVHRDIKPENLMRRQNGVLKILDFGIAKLLEQPTRGFSPSLTAAETELGVLVGTVTYMSPEQLRCLALDERADVWSAGVVLYELLNGRRPFEGTTRADTIATVLEREPAPLFETTNSSEKLLSELQRVVSKALQKDREDRYQTAEAMLYDLKAIKQRIEAVDVKSKPAAIGALTQISELPALAARPGAHNIGRWAMVMAALLVVIIGGTWLYRRAHRTLPAPTPKAYAQMNQAEQLAFVSEQEQRISAMMGERPMKLNDEALQVIKKYVDNYAARVGNTSGKPGRESLEQVYQRAVPYVPLIAHSFAERRIPTVVGIYLPMIESEYKPCFENGFGAKGLFQFLPQTAQQYGVARADMCDAQKMAPAAAHYIADRMAELGDDAQSMTLVLLSYNQGTSPVLDSLRLLRESDKNYERNFWTMFANRERLDENFKKEGAYYVPSFFAAAIVGENPEAFGLKTRALSSLAGAR